jgi:hypothetical protein
MGYDDMSTDGVSGAGDGGNSNGSDNGGSSISEGAQQSLDGGGGNDRDRGAHADAAPSTGGADQSHGYDEVGTDVPANDPNEPSPAERAASQERMEAEARSAKQTYEARQSQAQPDQSYADALDQEVAAQNAAATAADRIAAHTTSKNQRGGQPAVQTVHEDRIAADIVHMAQTDPIGAQAVYDAAQRQLGAQAPAMQSALETELARDQLASDRLLGEATFEPPDPAQVAREADRLVEAHTSTFGTRGGTTREVFDVNSMSYEIEQMALDDPSMAAAVRAELARELTPAQVSDMNRMIAGEANWEENLEIGFENPLDGLIGIGKGMANGVSDLAEITLKGVGYADAFGDRVTADIAGFVGLHGVAAVYDGMAARTIDAVAAFDVPEFDLANRAQQGGAVMGTVIDIALAGKGLVTGAAKLAARNADEVAAVADNFIAPNGVTLGMRYDADTIRNFDYGQHLRDLKGPAPEAMFDPHAHHGVFKIGNGARQQELVREAQDILRQYDIDPIYGPENLNWAPNRVQGQHSIDALQPLVEDLRELAGDPNVVRGDLVQLLDQYARESARRGQ